MIAKTIISCLFLQILMMNIFCFASWECDFPPKEILEGKRWEYKGQYNDYSRGYSVIIPNKYVGYFPIDPDYANGFGIPLGTPPERYIGVYSQPNSLECKRPIEEIYQLLEPWFKGNIKVQSLTMEEIKIREFDAAVLFVKYKCPKSSKEYQLIYTVIFSPAPIKNIQMYIFSLYSNLQQYKQDRQIYDDLLDSFKFIGMK